MANTAKKARLKLEGQIERLKELKVKLSEKPDKFEVHRAIDKLKGEQKDYAIYGRKAG